MSEQTPTQEREHNSAELQDHGREELDKLLNEKANESKHEHAETIDEIRQEAAAESKKTEDIIAETTRETTDQEPASTLVNADLKDIKYKRTLQSVRKDLNKGERAFSKVVHNPLVDALSNGAGKTVARPSGILTGSIFAFLSTSIFLYYAKHTGFTFNYLVMTLFFVGGFAFGLLAEFAMRLVKKAPKA